MGKVNHLSSSSSGAVRFAGERKEGEGGRGDGVRVKGHRSGVRLGGGESSGRVLWGPDEAASWAREGGQAGRGKGGGGGGGVDGGVERFWCFSAVRLSAVMLVVVAMIVALELRCTGPTSLILT